ncbi:MAG: hypothetical protein N3I35_03025 [Clostridia bacterium]|nr:hypothetical protein [Clostridia bacterium]
MFIRWLIGALGKSNNVDMLKAYPMVFSIHEYEIRSFLDWMRNHECEYSENNQTRIILNSYTNDEIIENGLVSMVFEQYGNDGHKFESNISLILEPSTFGTNYKIKCKCCEEFRPGKSIALKMKTA